MKIFASVDRVSDSRELARSPLHPRARPDVDREFDSSRVPASAGNLAILRALGIRAKLNNISQPSDPEEQEADRLADAFVSKSPVLRQTAGYGGAEEAVARKADGETGPAHSISALHGSESGLLPPSVRRDYERFFGTDLSDVRVHTGEPAQQASRSFNAQAFTIGREIVFGAGQYAPESAAGRKLLAHELAHVVQQATASTRGDSAAQPARIHRSPRDPGGTESLHEDLVEDYRAAHGLPPHGIDPSTGAQVGPTDAEIRFGGLLDAWLRGKFGVPAPAKAPTIVGAGTTDVKTDCRKEHKDDEDAYHACRRHREFVQNVLPQAIENIRNVPSSYSAAIAKLYASVLPVAKYTPEPRPGGPSTFASGFPGKLSFGATTRTLNSFAVGFHQRFADTTAKTGNLGSGAFTIELNETDPDVALQNLPEVEAAMVHEAIHVFASIVEENNANRAAGTAAVDPNLDRASYAPLQARLESAVLPFVTQILALPSAMGQSALSAQFYASLTASKLLGEAFAFTEAGIFAKQRAGQEFTAQDLSALLPFYTFPSYWEPQPTVEQELISFLLANRAQIERDVKPIILQVGEKYLSLRP